MNRLVGGGLAVILMCALQAKAGPSSFYELERADVMIGKVVCAPGDDYAGKVVDLAIDWQEGRVVALLIDTGKRIVAVPSEGICAASKKEYQLKQKPEAFSNAPAVQPFRMGSLVEAENILGLTVRNERNQRLAKVKSLMVELPSGRMPRVILASIGFLGLAGKLTAVPPEAFRFEPAFGVLILNTTRRDLQNARHFASKNWKSAVNNSFNVAAVDDPVNVLHSWSADGRVEIVEAREIPLPDDPTITTEITKKILETQGLSVDARHVIVVTRDRRVTLRGEVDSDKERDLVGDIAASVVGLDRVENKLLVKLFALSCN